MTHDDILSMAREAGMPPVEIISDKPVLYPAPDALARFADLICADEREACAKILDRNAAACASNSMLQDVLRGNALAIRARGSHGQA